MIKKFKRYIYELTYEESMKILIGISIIIILLITDLVTSTSFFTHIVQYDTFLAILFLLATSVVWLSLIIVLLYFCIFRIYAKKIIKHDVEATSILKNAAKSSNDRIFEIIPYNNNDFIMEVINFYREKKNIYNYEEKNLRFWLKVEDVVDDVSNIKIKLYITDKDSPNEKICFPLGHRRPFYILKSFKIK